MPLLNKDKAKVYTMIRKTSKVMKIFLIFYVYSKQKQDPVSFCGAVYRGWFREAAKNGIFLLARPLRGGGGDKGLATKKTIKNTVF